ncbi:restriction endonuclease subunit S [Phocaeicola barnesiae]|uniref:restriction endonuclease subunit S n=1 Tax=Phocaeicola barnesiae TaxID=376804 RepID=UPI000373759A|nr:restriction endonuclease subunit S [Phocaeicola barnesiae]
MNKGEMKRLGDYIREVDIRDRDLEVTKLLGVSISKEFMPSIANTIGTDMSSYKVVEPRQFAYGPVTSRNGDKVSIALYKDDEKAIVSQAYTIFEVKNKQELLPEYLMMWFRRPEFDRYARFKSHGSAREIFSWEEMCDVELPIPPIEQQQKIVFEYEAITRRIRLNEQIITKLEKTAQTLYRKMFVDGIDKEDLPEGWKIEKLGDYVELSQGVQVEVEKQSLVKLKGYNRFIRIIDYTPNSSEPPRYVNIINERYFCTVNDIVIIRYGDAGTICRRLEGVIANNLFKVSPIKRLTCNYLYYFLRNEEIQKQIKNSAASSTMPAITHSAIKNLDCLIPSSDIIKSFDDRANVVEKKILLLQNEICKLKELQSLLLAKMGQKSKYYRHE